MKILVVAGARPNFMKVAPLMRQMRCRDGIDARLVHTGQHYDEKMSRLFFDELQIPRPDIELQVGSGSHAVQTAEVMKRFEPVLESQKPNAVVVVGDVNSTLACALTAVKLGVPVAHVEAGLRSFDRTMPEEINRLLTDAISRWLFVSERSGIENLSHEGIDRSRIFFVGNVMIDTLLEHRNRSEQSPILDQLGLTSRGYAVLTLHRPACVDDCGLLTSTMRAVTRIAEELPVIFPVHPRTRKGIEAIFPNGIPNSGGTGIGGLLPKCLGAPGSAQKVPGPSFAVKNGADLRFTEPLGYLDFLKLMAHARLVLTDSGGVQEETTVLGVPCLTLRTTTERPATVAEGTNTLVGLDPERIVSSALEILDSARPERRVPELWDGRAAKRIVEILAAGGGLETFHWTSAHVASMPTESLPTSRPAHADRSPGFLL